jgi:hypothetical protein
MEEEPVGLFMGRRGPLGLADDGYGATQLAADQAGAEPNDPRVAALIRALEASVCGDSSAVRDLYTSDVKGWSPGLSVSSAAELAVELEDHDAVFTDPELVVRPLEASDDRACVEWTATVTHSGPMTLDDDVVIEPTGVRCRVHGVTVAEFDGDRIRSFRQYWDEAEVLLQLGLLPPT